ncbi:Ig-like domain-containing protein [Chryseobacterium oryzae]|uniref:T9SS type A sorting domain-containing protein n=1 Tax=Chryseobacterium oryzae TaxID=2929799 RepID=A0ABY4BJT2_9FLAO|nr:T9SS type A sorting domain-containing protein [Chryseobacterium oryzae]UOE37978.1 T9SS type A sorting domain-containing protein [Chryseobacterium oryzae]
MSKFYQLYSWLKKSNLKVYAILLLLLNFNFTLAQVSAYNFAQSAGTFVPISGNVLGVATGNTSATNLNSEVYNITLPFGFAFNDVSYTSLNVSSNGFITFGTTPPLTTTTTPISATVAYAGAISAFGRDITSLYDISGATGKISWDVIGTAPNREIVIQWRDFRPTNVTTTNAAYTFSFQIRLKETSNVIDIVYGSGSYLVGNTVYASTAQVGLRGSTNLDFNNRLNSNTLEFTNSTVGTANTSVQSFSTIDMIPGMPSAGLTYTWTPPTCYSPTGLSTISSTANTANITWNAISSAPSNGYEVYYSTNNTLPTSSSIPQITGLSTSSVTLQSLLSSKIYYVWVRSSCGSGSYSSWSNQPVSFATQCQPTSVISTTGNLVCPGTSATLSATTSSGATLKWYDSATGNNLVGSGPSFTTPVLNTTTNYYVSASTGTVSNVGKVNLESNAITGGSLSSYLVFTANSDFTLNTVDLFPYSSVAGTPGTVTITLFTSSGTPIISTTVNVIGQSSVALSVPQTVTVNFPITGGVSYRLGVSAWTGITNMYRDSINLAFPYSTTGVVDITGGSLSTPYYYFFYNWKISTGCESPRTMVTATVDAVACLSTAESNKKNNIKVYPNPFTEVVKIDRPELINSITITDVSGKLLRSSIKLESELKLNDIAQGMYILILDMKDGSKQSIKLIKK